MLLQSPTPTALARKLPVLAAHTLFGGQSSRTRAAGLRAMLLSLIAGHRPGQLGFVVIDTTGGLGAYDRRYLLAPVAGAAGAGKALELVARVMDVRRAGLSGVAPERIIVAVDDAADLGRDVLATATRLVQRGRAEGIHVALSTGRPRELPEVLLWNCPSRVAYRFQDAMDARHFADDERAAP
jgi:DNA segregation ATPase FtsK/SpoIIIE-like protein